MIEFKITGDYIPMIQLLKATNLVQTGGEAQTETMNNAGHFEALVVARKIPRVK